jgi:putative endonuclease
MERQYFVYIMSSRSRNLYTGVTNNLIRRTAEHKFGTVPGPTSKHKTHRLVYAESFTDIRVAISRERQVKSWRRAKKIALIETMNPTWKDLAEGWFPEQGLTADLSPCSG